ncbi:MAG: acyl-CoA reductase-like NAD-dependent aldehyde dehydrogenase [Myxococcota bacterium]|jgi:acyl-CoA reductase-like NAD-dependent aldehyde dehydrogenase
MQRTVSPVTGQVFERPLASHAAIDATLTAAAAGAASWRRVPLAERIRLVGAFVDAVTGRSRLLAHELTLQMGRPIAQTPGEIAGFADRARTMLALGPSALADVRPPPKPGFERFVRREPLGVVLVLAPWNYPWLTAVNAIVPALVAGNAVLLKHSDQTPLVAERLGQAAEEAGLPAGVFAFLHLDHPQVSRVVADPRVDFVAFTGSVEGGRAVHAAAAGTYKAVGLELGGKDPAYIRPDVDVAKVAAAVADGAFYNSGQSCCAVERVYVHRDVYAEVVDAMVAAAEAYVLGDPLDPSTTLGPVVRERSADAIRAQVAAGVAAGARPLVDPSRWGALRPMWVAPQVLVDVDHSMALMTEETFGPVVGVMAVDDDAQAIALMNDSRYGLTASVWTDDAEVALSLAEQLDTGTVFQNRCDALDPELAWVGVRDSGRGCTLSRVGYEHLTRPKSFHLRREW